jgi:hypothetical protein
MKFPGGNELFIRDVFGLKSGRSRFWPKSGSEGWF